MKCEICGKEIPKQRLNRGSTTCSKKCRAEQRKEYAKKWREENPEKKKEYNRKWYRENPEKKKEYNRKWREENPEKQKEYNREWYRENAEQKKEYAKKWREENPDYAKKWREENPEKQKEYNRKRYEDAYIELSEIADISIDELKKYVPPMFISRELDCWEEGSYFLDFIVPVQERAGGRCELTGKKSSNLEVHHLNGYNWCIEGRVDPKNAICIDKAVHKAFHDIYGMGDNTREQWDEFKATYQKKSVTLDNWL